MTHLLFTLLLLLSGCSTLPPSTQACLDDPPPVSDSFRVGMCKTLLSLPERDRADRTRWETMGAIRATPVSHKSCDAACQEIRLDLMESMLLTPPSAPLPEETWMFYSTPHGTYTHLGDGYIVDPQNRIYVPY